MSDVVVGLLAVGIGGLFCFRGWLMLRIIIPVWGGFVGFMFGAGLVAAFADESFLGSLLGWIIGGVTALIFGLVAYIYYEVSVVIAMAAIGFSLSTTVLVALGVTWNWVTILVGIAVAALLAFVAIAGDLPMVILTVLSAFAGASTIVAGLMLIFGVVDTGQFSSAGTTRDLDDDWWWYAIYFATAVAGLVSQFRLLDRVSGSLRQAWVDSGGKELRSA